MSMRTAIAEVAAVVLSLRPLAEGGIAPAAASAAADAPPPAAGCLTPGDVAALVAGRLGVRLAPGAPAGAVAEAATRRLREALRDPAVGRVPAGAGALVAAIADDVARRDFDGWSARRRVVTPDGVVLRAYAAGDGARPAVVVASASGMPARLCEQWMRFLAADRFVVTWETRCLFGPLGAIEGVGHGVDAQAGDLVAVMDAFGLEQAHVMGLCGGAVVALGAAAHRPERVSSLSLWHGDYELGPDCPKTEHQRDLKALMAMAAEGRDAAAAIHGALAQGAAPGVPPDLAHLVLYPYASLELFYRYCLLTGAIMAADVAALVREVPQPALVVTSEDDTTAHPAGSGQVALALADAVLHVEAHGDHVSFFAAGPRLRRSTTGFLAAREAAAHV